MAKSLKEVKEELKKAWEECFKMKIEDKLNDKGLEHFWSDDTSEEEAADLHTAGAIDMLVDDMLDDLLGIVIIKGNPNKNEKSEKKNESNSDFDYNVFDTVKQEFVSVGHKTWEIADEEAKKYCLENGVKYADVKICKMYDQVL